MADDELGPSAPKQMRSEANTNETDFDHVELPPPQRKLAVETNLMILNDDCLLNIFEHLRTIDLRYVLQVNVRLEALVKYYVQYKYQIEAKPKICPDFTNGDIERMGHQKAILYLQIFGHQIRSLNMDCISDSLGPFEVNRLVKYSSANKVTLINLFDPIFLMRTNPMENLWFEQLDELRMEHIHHYFSNYDLRLLLSNCTNLKRFSVVYCDEISTGFFGMLPTLKNLEEFEYKMSHAEAKIQVKNNLRHLLFLKKLKVLKFGFSPKQTKNEFSVTTLLRGFSENGIAIEHLELSLVRGDDGTYMRIAQLKSIKILKLNYLTGLQKEHVVHIAQELQLLQELHIRMNSTFPYSGLREIVSSAHQLSCLKINAKDFTFGNENYQEISSIVRNRPNKNQLELTIYGDDSQQFSMDQANAEQFLLVKHLKRTDDDCDLWGCQKSSAFHFVGQPKVRSLDDENDESDGNDEDEDEEAEEGEEDYENYEFDEINEFEEMNEIEEGEEDDENDEFDEIEFDEMNEFEESDDSLIL